jgi:hypothetical protein
MPNSQFHTAISVTRFARYFSACENNKRQALKLYRANIILSQKMYAVIGVFEIILRNSIDRHFIIRKGNNWLADAVQPDGYLDIAVGCEDAYHAIQEAIHKLGVHYTHDRLIAKLPFGFWTHQFAAKEYAAAGNSLLEIFPNRPFGTNQKKVFQNLIKINDIRNRIAHYEPICFDKTTGKISTSYAERRYLLILELLYWLGCNPGKILFGIDHVRNAVEVVRAFNNAATEINNRTKKPDNI